MELALKSFIRSSIILITASRVSWLEKTSDRYEMFVGIPSHYYQPVTGGTGDIQLLHHPGIHCVQCVHSGADVVTRVRAAPFPAIC